MTNILCCSMHHSDTRSNEQGPESWSWGQNLGVGACVTLTVHGLQPL